MAMIDQLPRLRLASLPTPLEPLDRLASALGLGAGRLFVKRDDLTGLAMGGNKARKLEFSLALAVASGADVIVTGGAAQSNHVRMTAAAARRAGLGCSVVLTGPPPEDPEGNAALTIAFGARITWNAPAGYEGIASAIDDQVESERSAGNIPFPLPPGGASAAGNLAYVLAAAELRRQCPDLQLVVTADASGGTHAGLAAGLGDFSSVLGVDVGLRTDLRSAVGQMASEAAKTCELAAPLGEPQIDHAQVGDGYGRPTDACREAFVLCAELEGILVEPTYTAKAMAALIARARRNDLPDGPVIFLHTGGHPELFIRETTAWFTSEGANR